MKLRLLLSLSALQTAALLIPSAYALDPALVELGQGIKAYNLGDFPGAVTHLRTAQRVPRLADYVTYHLASAEVSTGDIDGAIAVLNAWRSDPIPSSPLLGKITVLHARALLDKHDSASISKALEILQSDYKVLPEPDGDFAEALAYEAQGEAAQAVLNYQRVYYSWPNTDLAAQSWTALERLRATLGADFPAATARQRLERCEKWLAAKEYYKARDEYASLAQTLTGPEKDDAKVGVGVAEYMANDPNSAFRYLKALELVRSDADAQRLYYMTEAARKLENDAGMMEAVDRLNAHYPQSSWRLKALVAAGNRYLLTNDHDKYTDLFKAAFEGFPADAATAYCHWKVAWDAYLGDKPERATLLREQIQRYPDDTRASSALYFLGRVAESEGKFTQARAYYDKLSAVYPHYFYGVLARQRAGEGVLASAKPEEDTVAWLTGINWPARRDFTATAPNPATENRIERARLLSDAGLPELAESELRYGAKSEGEQPQLLGLELARTAPSPFRALRVMKSFGGDYLSLPTDSASLKFWQALFPLPYKDEVFASARARGLDPFYVAALIRQESEFNPAAHSPANAYGLMQLIPSTGRLMGRQEGIKTLRTSSLLNPELNIRLGTQYLRGQLENWAGNWYQTLAAYNAGPTHVKQWLSWGNYREPAEFVESIPFTETREYVQAVLRNADMYRELYSGEHSRQLVTENVTAPIKLASYTPSVRTTTSIAAPVRRTVPPAIPKMTAHHVVAKTTAAKTTPAKKTTTLKTAPRKSASAAHTPVKKTTSASTTAVTSKTAQ